MHTNQDIMHVNYTSSAASELAVMRNKLIVHIN